MPARDHDRLPPAGADRRETSSSGGVCRIRKVSWDGHTKADFIANRSFKDGALGSVFEKSLDFFAAQRVIATNLLTLT